jgi:hypothetical protein
MFAKLLALLRLSLT